MTDFNPEFESLQEDISAQFDLISLVQKYLVPIEKIRSLSKISFAQKSNSLLQNFDSLTVEREPQESLTHAFYRLLGLPAAAPDGSFYSPGFQPGEVRKIKRKQEIANKLAGTDLENILIQRELLSQEKKSFFAFQDLRSTFLAIILKIPRAFQVWSPNSAPLQKDEQKFILAERKKELEDFLSRNPNLEKQSEQVKKYFSTSCFSADLTHGQQIIKPFCVHPKIENAVIPDDKQICVPFLSSIEATSLSSFTSILRPGIELILLERIAPTDKNGWLANVEKILSGSKSPSKNDSAQVEEIKNSISSLLNASQITDENILKILEEQNDSGVVIFNQLIKTLRFLAIQLVKNMQILDAIENQINWYPVFSPQGPSDGKNGAFLLFGAANNFPLDQKILELRVKKLDAEKGQRTEISTTNFASPFETNFSDTNGEKYSFSLDEALQARLILAQKGFQALQEIEFITGEISGLGLVDVIILYAALWSMPLSSLIGLLDADAYERMKKYFTSFYSVIESISKDNLFTSLQNLEKYVFNLHVFMDRLVTEEKLSFVRL